MMFSDEFKRSAFSGLVVGLLFLSALMAVLAVERGAVRAEGVARNAVSVRVIEAESGDHVWLRQATSASEAPMVGVHWEQPGSVYADLRGGSSSSRHGYPDVAVIAQDGEPPILQVSSPDGEVIQIDLFRAAKVLARLIEQQ